MIGDGFCVVLVERAAGGFGFDFVMTPLIGAP